MSQGTPGSSAASGGSPHSPETTPLVVVPSAAEKAPLAAATDDATTPVSTAAVGQVQVNREVLDVVTGRGAQAGEARAAQTAHAAQEKADLNHAVHLVLVVGLVLSVALMVTGIALDLARQQEIPTAVPSLTEAVQRALALRPSGFLALGLIVLVATPIVRVVGSCLVFLYERDWRYAVVTAVVLCITLISIRTGAG